MEQRIREPGIREPGIREPGIREPSIGERDSYRGIAASAQAQRALGRAVAEATSQIDLPITGMTCASCVTRIEKALGGVEGVQQATVNLPLERATVT
ncbi:MAG: heavy-metal-associated domain-containing protein, partial [Sandaracinaceae bacterium]|nr:heavy-metal-associated domain-containing protein [Sandaracinaceae bacterium]